MDNWCLSYYESNLSIDAWLNENDRVILLQGSPALIDDLKSRGIEYLNICFSKGLSLELYFDKNSIDLTQLQKLKFFKANKMINGTSLISPKALSDFLKKVRAYLSEKIEICLWYENANYYQELIDKTTREQRSWPGQGPKISAWDKKRFDLFLKDNALNVLETSVENDPILDNPNFENYQFVNGVDCKIYLSEFENRRELFEKKHYHICTLAS